MRYHNDPDGTRLPVKVDTTTNGEFAPIPLAPVHHLARKLAVDAATRGARRLAVSRRAFLVSACGAASTLLAMNAAHAARGPRGGYYDIPPEAALDLQVARSTLDRSDFIFDVQGHFVNPTGAWLKTLPPGAQPLRFTETKGCAAAAEPGLAYLQCIGPDEFVKDIFLDSDTDLIVLSFVPSTREGEPLTIEEAAATARIVEKMDGTHRIFLHGRVNPNQEGDLEAMDMLAEKYRIAAWKTYTQWGPDGKGFFLDDEPGLKLIEKARKLGIRNIAIHKGLPFGPRVVRAFHVRRRRPRRQALSRRQLPDLSRGLRAGSPGRSVRSEAHRRHRRAHQQPAAERCGARRERLRRARLDVALPDARPGRRGARRSASC